MSAGFEDLQDALDEDGNISDEAISEAEKNRKKEEEESEESPDVEELNYEEESESENDDTSEKEEEVSEESDSTSTGGNEGSQSVSPIEVEHETTVDSDIVESLSDRHIPGTVSTSRYPYAMRRGGWDDERSGNRKFVMRSETKEMEDIAVEEVKEELFPNTDINITDVREATYIVGLMNFDEVVDVLNQWGFAEKEEMRK